MGPYAMKGIIYTDTMGPAAMIEMLYVLWAMGPCTMKGIIYTDTMGPAAVIEILYVYMPWAHALGRESYVQISWAQPL